MLLCPSLHKCELTEWLIFKYVVDQIIYFLNKIGVE